MPQIAFLLMVFKKTFSAQWKNINGLQSQDSNPNLLSNIQHVQLKYPNSMELSTSRETTSWVATQKHFMEPEGSIPHSEEPYTGSYPVTDSPNLYFQDAP
jgi:hypothetical protein